MTLLKLFTWDGLVLSWLLSTLVIGVLLIIVRVLDDYRWQWRYHRYCRQTLASDQIPLAFDEWKVKL